MLTLTAAEHLASVRARLEEDRLDEQGYNDLAVIALFYSKHARLRRDKDEGMALYDRSVRQRAAMLALDAESKNEQLVRMCLEELRSRKLALIPSAVAELIRQKQLIYQGTYEELSAQVWKIRNDPEKEGSEQ